MMGIKTRKQKRQESVPQKYNLNLKVIKFRRL